MERPRARPTKPIKPRKAARWTSSASTRPDIPQLRRWVRANADNTAVRDFSRYNVAPDVPEYDSDTYEQHLAHSGWSKQETDYLFETYRACNGKWPVIIDHYDFPPAGFDGEERTMEDLKARFYSVSAALLQLATPITSMTASEYGRYEVLSGFNPAQETSRKKLAEGHLYRKANEVDEETVLLGELQRIMLGQAALDAQREELRRRLDFPQASAPAGAYQYSTSQALTQLWQQLLAHDRMKKNPRLRATGNPAYDGSFSSHPASATAASSTPGNAGHRASLSSSSQRQPPPAATAASTPSAAVPAAVPSSLSTADQLRFGLVLPSPEAPKLSPGVSFASDRLAKPRVAKSAAQTEKIAALLASIGVPDLLPLPTAPVVESFEAIMHTLLLVLDARKVAEKEEMELKVRVAEKEAAEAKEQ